MNWQRLRLPK
jgi:hypothetical protein